MRTLKNVEAEMSTASTEEYRIRRHEELEQMASERLMRERYAEEYRRKLLPKEAPVSNNFSKEAENEAKNASASIIGEPGAQSLSDEEEQDAVVVPDLSKRFREPEINKPNMNEQTHAQSVEEPQSSVLTEEEQSRSDNGEDKESFIINKHYSGYLNGRISLPGAAFCITHPADPQSVAVDVFPGGEEYSPSPTANGMEAFCDMNVEVPKSSFYTDEPANPKMLNCHSPDMPLDFYGDGEPSADLIYEGTGSGIGEESSYTDDEPYLNYTAEPQSEHYAEAYPDYTAEPQVEHYGEAYPDYTAEPQVEHYESIADEFQYADIPEHSIRDYDAKTSSYEMEEEEYIRFLKENEAIDRYIRRRRAAVEKEAPVEVDTSDKKENVYAIVQKSNRTVEKRMLYLIRRLEYKQKMSEYTFGVYDYRKERQLRRQEKMLVKMKRKIKRASAEDKKALLRYYSALISESDNSKCKNPYKLESIKIRLRHLLHQRDEINGRLCELYDSSSFTDTSRVDEKANKLKLKYTRMLYKSQRSLAKRLKKLHAPIELKKKIYSLMNKKTQACLDIESARYLLKRKDPQGARRRELKAKIKKGRQVLRYINADIKYLFKKAEKHHDRHVDDVIHAIWVVSALFAVILGYLLWRNFELVKSWLMQIK